MGKDLMDDFVNEEIVQLGIPGFAYKPATAGQENEWLQHYWKIEPETKQG